MKAAFKTMYDKDLIKNLKSKLSERKYGRINLCLVHAFYIPYCLEFTGSRDSETCTQRFYAQEQIEKFETSLDVIT